MPSSKTRYTGTLLLLFVFLRWWCFRRRRSLPYISLLDGWLFLMSEKLLNEGLLGPCYHVALADILLCFMVFCLFVGCRGLLLLFGNFVYVVGSALADLSLYLLRLFHILAVLYLSLSNSTTNHPSITATNGINTILHPFRGDICHSLFIRKRLLFFPRWS